MKYFKKPTEGPYLIEDLFPQETAPILSADEFKTALIQKGVWPASLPGNVECWYPEVLLYVQGGHFTFEEFIDKFSKDSHFDYGETFKLLLEPKPDIVMVGSRVN